MLKLEKITISENRAQVQLSSKDTFDVNYGNLKGFLKYKN